MDRPISLFHLIFVIFQFCLFLRLPCVGYFWGYRVVSPSRLEHPGEVNFPTTKKVEQSAVTRATTDPVRGQSDFDMSHSLIENTSALSRNLSFKLPGFWEKELHALFRMIEARFRAQQTFEHQKKLDFVIQAFGEDHLKIISPAFGLKEPHLLYTHVKLLLMQHYTLPKQTQIHNLLHSVELGSSSPTDFLDRLRRSVISFDLNDQIIKLLTRKVFLDGLPINIMQILAGQPLTPLDELADLASQIMAVNPSSAVPRSEDSSQTKVNECLVGRLDHLTSLVDNMPSSTAFQPQSSSTPRTHGAKPSAPSSSLRASSFQQTSKRSSFPCPYHSRWGNKAHKCVAPCFWSSAAAGILN